MHRASLDIAACQIHRTLAYVYSGTFGSALLSDGLDGGIGVPWYVRRPTLRLTTNGRTLLLDICMTRSNMHSSLCNVKGIDEIIRRVVVAFLS